MAQILSTNTFTTAKYIVSATASDGTHTTIASALTSASSGDTIFIRPGTYVENLSLTAGVNLTAFGSDSSLNATGKVIISGTCTMTTAGSVTISGIQLQTNSAALLAVTGSAASIVNLNNCYFNCSNSSGITLSSSGAGATINIYNCEGNLGTTAIAFFTITNSAILNMFSMVLTNTGNSLTASTVSNTGKVFMRQCTFLSFITTANTAGIDAYGTFFNAGNLNTTIITTAGTSTNNPFTFCQFDSGTASAISVGSGTGLQLTNSVVFCSNTNAVTGAGTLTYSGLSFAGSSSVMNTTTQTAQYMNLGKWKASGQPAFLGTQNSSATNATGDGTSYTLGSTVDLTEVFDQDNNFAHTTGTFTAPVSGRYQLTGGAFMGGATAITEEEFVINTSNRNYRGRSNFAAAAVHASTYSNRTVLADMDAADTSTFSLYTVDSGGKVDEVFGDATDAWTYFSGFLVC